MATKRQFKGLVQVKIGIGGVKNVWITGLELALVLVDKCVSF